MIPTAQLSTNMTISETIETTKTYKLSDDKIQGFVDDLDAVKQAIYKMLNTEKFEYPIYSFSYGIELEGLVGKNSSYVKIELQRRIQECLLQDERVKSVGNFSFVISDDSMLCTFDVTSIYGDVTITKEVST